VCCSSKESKRPVANAELTDGGYGEPTGRERDKDGMTTALSSWEREELMVWH
jgi:hypothetical protein